MNNDISEKVKPYDSEAGGKKEQVTRMFDNIAGGYDFLNRLLSARFDVKWRNKLTDLILSHSPGKVLDVATGTGDVALTLVHKDGDVHVDGVDISAKMLEVAGKKVDQQNMGTRISLSLGDAEKMVQADNTYDVVTASFGVRNFEDLDKGLTEMHRVLRPEGSIYNSIIFIFKIYFLWLVVSGRVTLKRTNIYMIRFKHFLTVKSS